MNSCVHLVRAVQQRGERGVGIKNKLKKLNVWKGNPSCSFVEILEREEYRFRFRFRERFRSVSAINKDAFFFSTYQRKWAGDEYTNKRNTE